MSFKKRLWSIILMAALILGTMVMPANLIFAASDDESQLQAMAVKKGEFHYGDSFKWTLDSEGTLKITGKGYLNLSIEDLEEVKDDIKKIVITSGAKFISFDCITSLPGLVEISIPSTAKTLLGSLGECENLTTVTGGKNIEQVEAGVFDDTKWCQSSEHVILGKTYIAYNGTDKSVAIPEGIVSVSANAFKANQILESVTLPASVKNIYSGAFKNCGSLKEIRGGNSVSFVEYSAFQNTPWLESLSKTTMLGKVLIRYMGTDKNYTVSENVTHIYDGAFSNSNNLESVTIKSKITEIPMMAFENCINLKNITMPNTVTEIAYGAFDHCSSLTSIKLPSSLRRIEMGAFVFCKSLSKVTVNKGANNINLTSIGAAAFGGCPKLKSLTIPKKIEYIERWAYGYDFNDQEWNCFNNPIKIAGTSITGVEKTLAQTYAKENDIKFKSVKDDGTGNKGNDGLIQVKKGTQVKSAEKKKNGLTAPVIVVNAWTNMDETARFQILHISKKVKGASGYQIFKSYTGKSGSWSSLKNKKGIDVYFDGQKKKTCYYKVRAYKKVNGKTVYGPYSNIMKVK